ncbi:hypothetical protein L5515_007977 [Caenorhabditis briggsae]|uniref:PNPLA domain-containing protein n=1 Tax=Caenorhabditis briggsae TaxID=6238 RepID=A0AAE9A0J3_CAEBR|nr:hypothetical protein L3Y34_008130 [Caenorhabditis briggsae]UMM35272.1 hypothetical protein L5515_007977 [Caenorhabditis briggsae]
MKVSSVFLARLKDLKEAEKLALSFSGCGFLGAYNFGAANRLIKDKIISSKVDRVAGASAGSLVAAILVLEPEKINDGIETLYTMADHVHSQPFGAMTPGYYLNDQLVKIIDDFLPADIEKAQGKLHISITNRKRWENVMINKFDSRDHLISCLLASCYIPMYSMGYRGVPPVINEEEYIDGGMTNNLPTFSDVPTITCSPFSSQADICPEDPSTWNVVFGKQTFKASTQNLYRGARALFPPTRHILKQYYEMGQDDAETFIQGKI